MPLYNVYRTGYHLAVSLHGETGRAEVIALAQYLNVAQIVLAVVGTWFLAFGLKTPLIKKTIDGKQTMLVDTARLGRKSCLFWPGLVLITIAGFFSLFTLLFC